MKKVVLIGAGDIGGQALKCLGPELVEYFVDNHKAGQTYFGKPVYSIEKLLEDQEKCLFLLTIANMEYRNELIDQLYLIGIKDFYYFEQAIYLENIFQKSDSQIYTRKSLFEDMKGINPERVCILGCERKIGRFIAELFGIEKVYDETEFYSSSDLTDKYDYIFVNVKNYSCKLHNQLKSANIKVYYIVHYYNCNNFLVRKGLAKFYKKYREKKRCFIIGNGPSLDSKDLDMLASHNEFCLGLNMVHKVYDRTKWRPDYICISDKFAVYQTLDHIFENNNCPLFLTDDVQLHFSPFQYDGAILYHEAYNRDIDYHVIRFETDLSSGTIPSAWTVSYVAIQLAVYMGFDEIYLLGMDNSNWREQRSDNSQSECPIIQDKSEELLTWVCRNAYKRVKAASTEFGFKVYNATRGGCLEEFKRVNFDEIFNG